MKIDAILFDVNGTLTDIMTDEGKPDVYRSLRNFLQYQGIQIHKDEIRDAYFRYMKEQRDNSPEKYPEFDVVKIFERLLAEHTTELSDVLAPEQLARVLARLFRANSLCKKLRTYPKVKEILRGLEQYRLGVISDGQHTWARAELHTVGLLEYFHPILVSGDFGYRKPDRRLFERALNLLDVEPQNTVFIGNDMYRDVYGAGRVGMRTVLFHSNQGDQRRGEVEPDYRIYEFAQLPAAIEFLKNH